MSEILYFDYNATHPPIPQALAAGFRQYRNHFFNPSGATRFSLAGQAQIEAVREFFASRTGLAKEGFVFCSTGTEAIYLLIHHLKNLLHNSRISRVLVSPYEHPAIYAALVDYQIDYQLLPGYKDGLIHLVDVKNQLENQPPTALIVLYAGNETGVIQPITELGQLACQHRGLLFSDLIQAFAKINIDFHSIDGFVLSGHKIGAGPGSSLCYIQPDLQAEKGIFAGGNQENSFRAGTENLMAISSLQRAAEIQLSQLLVKNRRLLKFRQYMETRLQAMDIQIIARDSPRLASTTFAILPIDDLDFFMLGLEEKGIIVANGSSCKSRSRQPSEILLRMGYCSEEALRAIRISTGLYSEKRHIHNLLFAIEQLLKLL